MSIFRRKTYDEQLADIRREYGPPPMKSETCDLCGKPVNTEIVWYFRSASGLTGSRTTHNLCDDHGREAHNAIAHLLGFQHVDEPTLA